MAVQVLSKRAELLNPARVPHLSDEERALLAVLIARLEQECEADVSRVILYGSKARGDFDFESDVDLLVTSRSDAECIEHVVTDLQKDIDFNLYPVIYTNKDHVYNKWLLPPFYVNVRRDGIELWDEWEAQREEWQAPLNFVEGEFRTMNDATLELIRQYWEQTQFFWDDTKQLRQIGALRSAVSRGFYAAFHAISAVLYTVNVVRGKHSGVEAAISQFLVKPGLLEPEYEKMYRNIIRGRLVVDYGVIRKSGEPPRFEKLSDDEMNEMLDDTEKFIARMEQFLRERGAMMD